MTSIKPQASAFYDELDVKAEGLFHDFQKTNNLELLLKSASLYEESKNPDGKQIASLFRGIYYKQIGEKEKNNEKAISYLDKSIGYFKNVKDFREKDIKGIERQIVNRRIILSRGNKKELKTLFLKSAELNKDLGKIESYHADMALHWMYSSFDFEIFDKEVIPCIESMIEEAKLSGMNDLIYKSQSLLHMIKAGRAYNPKSSLDELEKEYEAIQKTSDKYGAENAEARILYAKAMTAGSKRKRAGLFMEAGRKWLENGNEKEAINVAKMISPMPINVMAIIDVAEKTIEGQNKLIKLAIEKNIANPRLNYHHSYLIERLKDFQTIMRRLGESRKKITELNIKRNNCEPKRHRHTISKKVQKIMKEQNELTNLMRLDLENLYVFGKILLDQWAFVIGNLIQYEEPNEFNFERLGCLISANKQEGALKEIWDKHRKDIFWLYYQVKGFRNYFIEHIKRPWQKGTTMPVYGDEFNLFIPTPPGYITEDEKKKKLLSVRRFMPAVLKAMPDDYWEKQNLHRTLEITFYRIDEIEKKEDRERVWNVWKDVGGSTLSYDKIGFRLIQFVQKSTDTLIEIIKSKK